MQLKLSEHL